MKQNENNTIHTFDFDMICDYFSLLQRQGPGSRDATLRALSFIDNLTPHALIADLGCGTGGQTMTLAEHTPCHIVALDLFPAFIDRLNATAAEHGFANRIMGEVGSMDALPFAEESIDVIWSEGAIYNIGFERGLRLWHNYLKTGGYIAVTESVWLTDERPAEIQRFWDDAYPEMDSVARKMAVLQRTGYRLVATFVLPHECWTDNFYRPQSVAQEQFLAKYADNPAATTFVEYQRHEAQLYERYKDYYGYAFFIACKI